MPRAPLCSLPTLTAIGAHPSAPGVPRLGHDRLGHGRGVARWSGPGPTTAPAPRGTAMARPPLSSPFSLSAAPLTELAQKHGRPATRPLPRHRPRSGTPLDRYLRPLEASPSRWILLTTAAVFPLSGERPPSFATPKLELILSSPFHTGAAGPHTRRRRASELPPRQRTPLSRAPLPPPRHPVVHVCAIPARLARRHREESLVLLGCTSPPVSRSRAIDIHATAPSRNAAGPGRQAVA
jgi:hypothetical protein